MTRATALAVGARVDFIDIEAGPAQKAVDELKGKSAIRWSASASQHGDFYGLKPTGKAIFFTGIEILAIDQDGLITERWGEWDGLSILEQITRSNETDAND